MKQIPLILLGLILLCGCNIQNPDNKDISANTSIFTQQIQPSLTETISLTTIEPAQSTSTPDPIASPMPTWVSTPTANFQNVKPVIYTPALPETCPPKAELIIVLPTALPEDESEFQKTILDILNAGGITQLLRNLPNYKYIQFNYDDLTNDGASELIISTPTLGGSLYVFGCRNGEFTNLLTVSRVYDYGPRILAIKDVNRDGVKELVVVMLTCHYCTGIWVYEWNGRDFESLVLDWRVNYTTNGKLVDLDFAELMGYADASIADIDNNGTFELILEGGTPSYLSAMTGFEGPWRTQTVVYMWDGKHYVWYSQKYSPPNFRFEAIQDGDMATIRGNYDFALASYQAAIFDDKLKSWDEVAWLKLVDASGLGYPDDIQKMPFNQTEYEQLSAYARYRIMILHLMRGWEGDAKVVYDTLRSIYPAGNPGYPYALMASEFWNEYQISHDLTKSCDKVISYTAIHKDILSPLGPHRHGLWDLRYEPESICPFH